jgi:lipopolysaccharide biosynthesis regulator YciM
MSTLLLLGAGLLLAIAILSVRELRKRKKGQSRHSDFLNALYWLIENKHEEALDALKKTVQKDTDNIMAYIQLGMLLRRMNQPAKAVKIHKNLLIRGELTEQETLIILHHLMLDYRDAGFIDLAIETAERLAQRNKKDVDAKQFLLGLYEERGDWEKAFYFRQSINKWLKKKDQDILALYKVNSGLQQIAKGEEREGRIRFREAIKLNKLCEPAYLYWGDSYRREGRNTDAFKIWEDFCQKNPEKSYLAFDRLKEVLYDLGRYGDFETLLENIRKKTKHPAPYLNLIEMKQKQGHIGEAFDLCEQLIEHHPDLTAARLLQVQLLQQRNDIEGAMEIAEETLQREMAKETLYHCTVCSHKSSEMIWYCPQCKSWNSFE